MRVLAVLKEFPSEQSPVAGIFALRRLQAMQALGHDIAVAHIVPYAPPIGKKWNAYRAIPRFRAVEGIPVTALFALFGPRLIGMEYTRYQLAPQLRRMIRTYKPDVLHASYVIPCGHAVVNIGVPAIVSAHGIDAYDWPFRRPALLRSARQAIAGATYVSAVSHSLAGEVQKILPSDVEVIWNGADESVFFPQEIRAARNALNLPLNAAIVTYAGTLVQAKGVFDLVNAAAKLDPRPVVVAAGNGPDADALRILASTRGVDLRLFGRLDQARLANLYAAADVVTLPSYNEGLPNVLVEAMLCRRAVVASTVGGIPEIVKHDESGLLVSPGNVDELSSAIDRVLTDTTLRLALAENAYHFATRNLTWRVAAIAYERLYARAVSESRPAPSANRTRTSSA